MNKNLVLTQHLRAEQVDIMTLFSFVRLKHSNTKLVVKTTWCQGMHSAVVKSYGNRPRKQRKIYYSPNEFAVADFSLEISTDFSALATACYTGFVIRTFGKFE